MDSDRKHLTSRLLRAAAEHKGTALVEIYQNCNIFNDGAFEPLKDSDTRDDLLMRLKPGEPIRFGPDGARGVARLADGSLGVVDVADVGEDAILIHNPSSPDPSVAFALSRLSDPVTLADTPIGVFRDVDRPSYDSLAQAQMDAAKATGKGDLATMLRGNDTWHVS